MFDPLTCMALMTGTYGVLKKFRFQIPVVRSLIFTFVTF
jgi:hypothetical protein